MEALHEPERGAPAPPRPARQGHIDRAGLEPRAPIPRFIVPMHAQERKETLPEPQRRAGFLPASVGKADGTQPLALARSAGRRDACPTLGPSRFKAPRGGL